MRFDVVTLFPAMFAAITEHGITRRAYELGLWSLTTWNPRDFTNDAHRTVDDRPYGGGPGMVMMAEPLSLALEAVRQDGGGARVIALAPGGKPLADATVRRWAEQGGALAIVCGRYEGIDQRFLDACVDEVASVGDFVMSGGELAAMALIDAVVRQLPGALKEASAEEESFVTGLLDGPHYTRPEVWRERPVPSVLLSGHHKDIEAWRRREALKATLDSRPELIRAARAEGRLTARDEKDLRELAQMGAEDRKSAA
ncbi:MAG TPA: tRNA (guanosine(37)-N1)-methyltransferase TrmD [Burkholderiaceae bacterium]|nr:tRNA (guanosine(37)-N1)-methyltransferase TrmD [Burkholderiaceae bacterium]HQR69547.1 tRNA (guanosine(37)-N1)-methyltransferase TrmD [Burkholderiaceae bacterium]